MGIAMTLHHTFCWLAIGMLAMASASELAAQDWLDPALNQPLPQYLPAGAQAMPVTRYPLEQPEATTTEPAQKDQPASEQPGQRNGKSAVARVAAIAKHAGGRRAHRSTACKTCRNTAG